MDLRRKLNFQLPFIKGERNDIMAAKALKNELRVQIFPFPLNFRLLNRLNNTGYPNR